MKILILLLTALVVLPVQIASAQSQPTIYWTDSHNNKIQRLDQNQGQVEDFLTATGARPGDLFIDRASGKMYWVSQERSVIRRSNLDGSEAETVAEATYLSGVALDPGSGKIYWSGASDGISSWGVLIQRANLDGSQIETLVRRSTGGSARDIALDLQNGKVYWTVNVGKVQRSNLDGSDVEDLVSDRAAGVVGSAEGLVLDVAKGLMYWTGHSFRDGTRTGRIYRAHLDGTYFTKLMVFDQFADRIDLDADEGKLYWTLADGRIRRANADGTDVEDVMTQAVRPFGIVLDGSRIFWTDEALSAIQSLDRVSGEMQTYVDSPLTDPRFIQLDPQNEKLYWGDGYVIRRANMRDGSGIEYWRNAGYLSQGQVAVDTGNETVYWTTWDGWMPNDNIGIFRTDLDQFDPVRLSTAKANCVTLDQENRKLYWIGGGSIGGGSIRRANLDGTDVENIIPRASGYNDFLTIDPIGRKLYWGWENGKVLRSNLDGTEIEKSGFSEVDVNGPQVGLAVDPSTDHVYWATTDGLGSSKPTARIFRASFSGTEVEEIFVASPAAILGIALDLNTIVASERSGEPEIPSEFAISGNYPNPFNPSTSIIFDLPGAASVSVQVFDVTGRMVMQTPEETFSAGAGHVVHVNATGWNSGLYLYKVSAQARTSPRLVGVGTGRMMLVK